MFTQFGTLVGYKLRKFAQKNKKLLVTTGAFAALLLLGVAASTWQAVRATQAEAAALMNEQQATASAAQAQDKEQEANQQRDDAQKQRDEAQKLRDEVQKQRDEIRALNDRLQRTLYAADMNLALHAWEAGGAERVRALLEEHRPKPGLNDLPGFEWYYLYRLCHAEFLTLRQPGAGVSLAYSPDGKRLASGAGGGRTVKVWDAQTGQEIHSIKDGGSYVAFSPDGKRLASGGGESDPTVKVWDAQTGQMILSFKGPSRVASVAFSPDGKRLASAGGGGVRVYDVRTGEEHLSLKVQSSDEVLPVIGASTVGLMRSPLGQGPLLAASALIPGRASDDYSSSGVAFSADGKRLASADGKTVNVWDAQTGQQLLSFKGHTDTVWSVAYSPDGKRLASAASRLDDEGEYPDEDATVKVWDAQTGQELISFKGGCIVAFSADGKRLVNTDKKMVKVRDAQTGQELLVLQGHNLQVTSVTFSPDGKRLASGSYDATVKIWDAQTSPKPLTIHGAAASSVASVAFSPDGKHLVLGGGDRSGSGPGELKVWNAQTGKEIVSLQGHTAKVTTVAYSPDGKRLASGSGDKTVKVWDAQTGRELLTFKKHSGQVNSVAFSPDGKRLASGSGTWDQTAAKGGYVAVELKVWDAQTGQELLALEGHNTAVRTVVFSPDGKRLASDADDDATVRVWDLQTGKKLLSITGAGGMVVFSPDGKRLASSASCGKPDLDPTARVWDAQTGKELLTLKGHTGSVASVAFSPDGRRLASAGGWGDPGTVKVWDTQTGQELLTLKGGSRVVFSPDGHRLASNGPNGTVTIWDATPLPAKP
jgi:WD40 repeat protein